MEKAMSKVALLVVMVSLALAGCGEKASTDKAAAGKAPAGTAQPARSAADLDAGRALAEKECKGCHGLDGKGAAPGIPHLAGQYERYLLAALAEYREGKRTHAALREIARHTSEPDARNVAAYYASLPPVPVAESLAQREPPYELGKKVAAACASCHGEDGNSSAPGVPSLAGQQPAYLVVATQEYLLGERKTTPMHGKLKGLTRRETENVALYFASQTPVSRGADKVRGDPKLGEPLSAVCGGCHGAQGVSGDSATPSLAGQDEQYLVEAIKAYRTSRKRENMRLYITGLSDKDIENVAAFYASQQSRAAEKGKTLVEDLTAKCNRCHAPGAAASQQVAVPRIHGQDRDYLVMALRSYRDDRRESSTMHKMSLPYGDSIIDSIATYYASEPAK
jgi:cytochrome c553